MSRMLEICLIIMNYFVRCALCENCAENVSVQLWQRYASHPNYYFFLKNLVKLRDATFLSPGTNSSKKNIKIPRHGKTATKSVTMHYTERLMPDGNIFSMSRPSPLFILLRLHTNLFHPEYQQTFPFKESGHCKIRSVRKYIRWANFFPNFLMNQKIC